MSLSATAKRVGAEKSDRSVRSTVLGNSVSNFTSSYERPTSSITRSSTFVSGSEKIGSIDRRNQRSWPDCRLYSSHLQRNYSSAARFRAVSGNSSGPWRRSQLQVSYLGYFTSPTTRVLSPLSSLAHCSFYHRCNLRRTL